MLYAFGHYRDELTKAVQHYAEGVMELHLTEAQAAEVAEWVFGSQAFGEELEATILDVYGEGEDTNG